MRALSSREMVLSVRKYFFVKPEPTYRFDHSHAWGGTPLYALPKALLGLEIIEPGMAAISLSPWA